MKKKKSIVAAQWNEDFFNLVSSFAQSYDQHIQKLWQANQSICYFTSKSEKHRRCDVVMIWHIVALPSASICSSMKNMQETAPLLFHYKICNTINILYFMSLINPWRIYRQDRVVAGVLDSRNILGLIPNGCNHPWARCQTAPWWPDSVICVFQALPVLYIYWRPPVWASWLLTLQGEPVGILDGLQECV